MKRGVSIALVALGFFVAGGWCTSALAASGAEPAPPYVPLGVRIAGVRVGGLDAAAAAKAVAAAFAKPLPVGVDGHVFKLDPRKVATAYVDSAVRRAHVSARGDNVPLVVTAHGAAVRAFVARLAKNFDRKGAPARLTLVAGRPLISTDRPGRKLRQEPVVVGVVHALTVSTRLPVRFKTAAVAAGLPSGDGGPVILINRALNRLTYFDRGELRRFSVATGQAIYPTPTGRFRIVVKWKNPWWYPPTYDSWARGLKPVPPGPFNPLGTRWMGLTAPGVGIHGTPDAASIGYSVSHGCIRMQIAEAEWLFNYVTIGTTVFIVPH